MNLEFRVFAQSHTTLAPVYDDYGITVNSSNVVDITLVEKPAVITKVLWQVMMVLYCWVLL